MIFLGGENRPVARGATLRRQAGAGPAKLTYMLAVDIGNTSAHFALFDRTGRALEPFRIPTDSLGKRAAWETLRRKLPTRRVGGAAIASVVPAAGLLLKKTLERRAGIRTCLLGKDLQVPIVNRYANPRQVGVDRLVNALAVWRQYRKAAVILDFGTAITLDVVSEKGEYLGGVIAPGVGISIEALHAKTALLPKVGLLHPRGLIGKDTAESIRIGCAFGLGGLCDRLIEELGKTLPRKRLLIATGGYAAFMARYCRSRIDQIDPLLTLKGVMMIYQIYLTNRKIAGKLPVSSESSEFTGAG
ncbi:MAG: type III pantothenate kinase [Candidatus Omnitrophica bacterium]|nr:type III pantothenate kinase [Candidatus Omnitrophota bacterium]